MGLELIPWALILTAVVALLVVAGRLPGGFGTWLGDWLDRVNESEPARAAPDYYRSLRNSSDD